MKNSKNRENQNFISKNAKNAWKPQRNRTRSKSIEDSNRAKTEKANSQNFYDLEIRGTVPQ